MKITESSKIGENASGAKKNSIIKNAASAAGTKIKNAAKKKFNNTSIGRKINSFKNSSIGKRISGFRSKKGKSSQNEESNNEENNENAVDNAAGELKEKVFGKLSPKMKLLLIKVGLYACVALFFIIIVITIIGILLRPFAWLFDDESSDNNDAVKKKIEYKEKLANVINKYENKCDISIDVGYIHSTLIYKYNLDMDKFFGEMDEDDFDEEDFESSMEGLEDDSDNEEQYDDMTDNIEKIVRAWVGNSCQIDYEIDGYSYNNLIQNEDIKEYFKQSIDDGRDIEDIINAVFEVGHVGSEYIQEVIDEYISEDLEVNINGRNIGIKEYIGGQVYLYMNSSSLNDPELIKTNVVVYSTNLVSSADFNKNKSSINVEENSYCDLDLGCSYSNNVLQSGPGLQEDGNEVFYNNKYYYKKPADSSTKSKIMDAVNSVFGDILLDDRGDFKKVTNESTRDIKWVPGGTTDTSGGSQDGTQSGTIGGNTYKEILTETYGPSKVENIKEDNYTSNVDYGNNTILTKAIFYDQTDYKNIEFCGRKGKSISSSGCGVTAMAIIASTYKNDKNFDPVYMMQSAYQAKYCGQGISGTNTGFYKYEAKKLGFTYQSVGKKKKEDLNRVLKNLEEGNLVIAHMGAGTFTNGGHYIVLGGVNKDSKQVYVYDPYNSVNKDRKKSGNGWYSFNDVIVKEVHSFYIIGKGK